MIWILAYVALVGYAAVMFTLAATRGRESAAIGILLGMASFQFAILNTLPSVVALVLGATATAFIARDVIAIVSGGPIAKLAPALARGARTTARH